MQNTRNHRLPAYILQADLDCITALKAIEGYAPSPPADPLSVITELQARVAAGERELHEGVQSLKNQICAQFGNDSNEVASLGLKKASKRKAPKRQSKGEGDGVRRF